MATGASPAQLLSVPMQCPDAKTTLTRLWVHENLRVFHDRLVCQEDKDFVTHALFDMLRARFDVHQPYEVRRDISVHVQEQRVLGESMLWFR